MHELAYIDAVKGPSILTWDGTTVEVFTEHAASTARLHRLQLHVTVKGPDRKGRYEVVLSTKPGGSGTGPTLFATAETWPHIEPFLQLISAPPAAPPA